MFNKIAYFPYNILLEQVPLQQWGWIQQIIRTNQEQTESGMFNSKKTKRKNSRIFQFIVFSKKNVDLKNIGSNKGLK